MMKIQWRGFLMSVLYTFSNVVYLNLLWLLFSMMGLFVFGVAPATIALMKCYSNFSMDGDYISFKDFFALYKEHFKAANMMQFVFLLVISLLVISVRVMVVLMNVSGFIPFFYLVIIFIILLVNLISLHTFEWYPEMKGLDRFKLAMFLFFRYPLQYVPVIFTLYFSYLFISLKATFIILAGVSLPIALISFLHKRLIVRFQNDFPEFGVKE